MSNPSNLNSKDLQELANKFVYEYDDSAFIVVWKSMADNLYNYIRSFLKKLHYPRIEAMAPECYSKTMELVYDNARKYYNKDKSKFVTWVYAVSRSACLMCMHSSSYNNFYVVNADVSDIDNDIDEDRYKYKVRSDNPEKQYTYEINGTYRVSNYSELMDDILECVRSCIYYLEDTKRSGRPNRAIFEEVYIKNKIMKDAAEDLNLDLCTVKNSIAGSMNKILELFSEKYSDLYRVIKEERIFQLNRKNMSYGD